MACELEACEDCTRRCLLVHEKKDRGPNTTLTSFFKVMIGDEFSKVLFVPPKFSRAVSSLVDQKFDLEDSTGQRWEVTLSNHSGSLAFLEGWHDFSLDHRLQVGDFVLFHYTMGSHFVVQIYKRSGCESVDFPWERCNCKKRKECCRDSVAKDGTGHTVDKRAIDKHSSSCSVVSRSNVEIKQSHCNLNDVEEVPKSKQHNPNCENSNPRPQPKANAGCVEDLFFMVNRSLGYKGEDRGTFFDLSNFEMCNNNAGAGRDEKAAIEDGRLHQADVSLKSQAEADLVGSGVVAEEVVGRVLPLETSKIEMLERENSSETDNMLRSNKDICNVTDPGNRLNLSVPKTRIHRNDNEDVPYKKLKAVENLSNAHAGTGELLMPQRELAPNGSGQPIKWKSYKTHRIREIPMACQNQKFQSGIQMETIKKERMHGCQNELGIQMEVVKKESVLGCQNVSQEPQGERMKMIKEDRMQVVLGGEIVSQELQGGRLNISVGKGDEIVNLPVQNSNEVPKFVITEPVESISLPSPNAANISCLVPEDDQFFLEVPACFPLHPCKGRNRPQKRVVILKDPEMRLWPGLYHESYAFKILGSGWGSFCRGNDIRPGDECVFSIETEPKGRAEGIYRVRVNRKGN